MIVVRSYAEGIYAAGNEKKEQLPFPQLPISK